MAKSCQIGVTAFDKWAVEPVKREGREAFYDVASVLRNRLDHEISKIVNLDGDGDIDDAELLKARIRLTNAQADSQELKNARDKSEVMDVELFTFILQRVAGGISSRLDITPMNLQRKYPDIQADHIEAVKKEIAFAANQAAAIHEELPRWIREYKQMIGQ